ALLLWGGWLVVTGAVFSLMAGIFHAYYTVALAPAIAALVAIGGRLLCGRRPHRLDPERGTGGHRRRVRRRRWRRVRAPRRRPPVRAGQRRAPERLPRRSRPGPARRHDGWDDGGNRSPAGRGRRHGRAAGRRR